MKYKIITGDMVKNLIDFLDDVQFEAAESKQPKDLNTINFCSYMINELLNSPDVFGESSNNDKEINDMESLIDEFDNMDDDRFNKTIQYFNSFFNEWDKKHSGIKNVKKRKSKKRRKLSVEEEFEKFYSEREKKKEEKNSTSLNKLLKDVGLRKSSGGSDTH